MIAGSSKTAMITQENLKMKCPHCQSEQVVKNGRDYHQDGKAIQNYLCKGCGKRLNERTGTAM
ncbi:MAG: IS1 family transposase, partial [Pseudanabaena sp. M34BS1SP1A06MG]|nr:IS1 family transposase [Pseudanabaena sp. M34BS1SP1A06MG]